MGPLDVGVGEANAGGIAGVDWACPAGKNVSWKPIRTAIAKKLKRKPFGIRRQWNDFIAGVKSEGQVLYVTAVLAEASDVNKCKK